MNAKHEEMVNSILVKWKRLINWLEKERLAKERTEL